jgi:hypothetical protein
MARWRALVIVLFLYLCLNKVGIALDKAYLTIYGSVLTGDTLDRTYRFKANFDRDYTFITVAVGKPFMNIKGHLDLGAEGQVAKHFGRQDHFELNGLIVQRWLTFPWNHAVKTSFAAGQGISYATALPSFEENAHGATAQFLGYLLFEFTFSLSSYPQWAVSTRIHHRSGANGVFSGVYGASNAFGIGLSYLFQ